MKASLESQRMYVSRGSLGSVAASVVIYCVLSLSSAAASSGDGFIDMSHAQAECCFTAGSDAPVAGVLLGPQATGSAFGKFHVASVDVNPGGERALSNFAADRYGNRRRNDLSEVPGAKNLGLVDTKLVGTALAPDKAAADGNMTSSESPANPDTTNGTGATGDADPASTEPAGGEFSGSAEPAGPDLTSTQEEELISGGWK